ncbi:type II secretion system protein GspM [Rhizobium sp. YIM 134829]|uniref:type II secretion system protein GspM n=1 Tax=Rhizobium sp. YIM 134829 TaxID=3390453 RepID=UPI00397E3ACD
MTTAPPSSRMTRIIAILCFIGLPLLFGTMACLNSLDAADMDLETAEIGMQTAAIMRKAERQTGSLDGTAMDTVFVRSATRTGALAAFREQVVTLISDAKGRVIETADASSGDDDPSFLSLSATLEIDNDGLLILLYQMESGLPLMTVETLSLRRSEGSETEQQTLRADLKVVAHWRELGP